MLGNFRKSRVAVWTLSLLAIGCVATRTRTSTAETTLSQTTMQERNAERVRDSVWALDSTTTYVRVGARDTIYVEHWKVRDRTQLRTDTLTIVRVDTIAVERVTERQKTAQSWWRKYDILLFVLGGLAWFIGALFLARTRGGRG